MDVLLPPPGETNDNNRKLAKVLEKLNYKLDTFNKNIDLYNSNIIKPPPPAPKTLFIPKYMLIIIVGLLLY